jgi:hypothetical protein
LEPQLGVDDPGAAKIRARKNKSGAIPNQFVVESGNRLEFLFAKPLGTDERSVIFGFTSNLAPTLNSAWLGNRRHQTGEGDVASASASVPVPGVLAGLLSLLLPAGIAVLRRRRRKG